MNNFVALRLPLSPICLSFTALWPPTCVIFSPDFSATRRFHFNFLSFFFLASLLFLFNAATHFSLTECLQLVAHGTYMYVHTCTLFYFRFRSMLTEFFVCSIVEKFGKVHMEKLYIYIYKLLYKYYTIFSKFISRTNFTTNSRNSFEFLDTWALILRRHLFVDSRDWLRACTKSRSL